MSTDVFASDGATSILDTVATLQEEILNLNLAKTAKGARRTSDLPVATRAKLKNLPEDAKVRVSGVAGYPSVEPLPIFVKQEAEKLLSADYGSADIVLGGTDRNAARGSGYAGDTQAAKIDMVVGRGGSNTRFLDATTGGSSYIDPDFEKDSARIYMSQKSKMHEYFNLKAAIKGGDVAAEGSSAVVIKADNVGLISRGALKLTTLYGGEKSTGGSNDSYSGIILMANNDNSDLQPLVKGTSLLNALRSMVDLIDDVRSILVSFLDMQMDFNTKLMNHKHISPFNAENTSESPDLMVAAMLHNANLMAKTFTSLKSTAMNLANHEKDFFEKWGSSEGKYILSDFNYTN
jgi:hypothetical protein